MAWSTRFESHPQFAQAVRLTTGRSPWVIKATVVVGVVVFAVPLIALAVLMIGALALTAAAWVLFSAIGRVIDAITGAGRPTTGVQAEPHAGPHTEPETGGDGRENVRVIQRP